MKKSLLVIACLVAVSVVSFSFIKADTPRYQNLKALPKDTNKHQMDSIMKFYSASLGVKCNFCHVRNNDEMKDFNFASDDNKHKKVAREMIKMTNNINKKFFDKDNNAITCYTCHMGHDEPTSFPPAKKEVTNTGTSQ